jgi:hypothetical protein
MKITITFNGGKDITIEAPNYNAAELTKQMNDPQITMVNVGNVVLGKHSVMMIAPTADVTQETPTENPEPTV